MAERIRGCSTDIPWDEMTLEEKVEALGNWSVLITKWAEDIHRWQQNEYDFMKKLKEIVDVYASKMNGGGVPPKHPKDPHC